MSDLAIHVVKFVFLRVITIGYTKENIAGNDQHCFKFTFTQQYGMKHWAGWPNLANYRAFKL